MNSPPFFKLALGKLLWEDAEGAAELARMISPTSLPDRAARELFVILARDVPGGADPNMIRRTVEGSAKDSLPLLEELLAETGTDSWGLSNEYLAERVADEGMRMRLERMAIQIQAAIAAGQSTADILRLADMQRAAVDLAGEKGDSRFLLRDDAELENMPDPKWLIEGFLPDDAIVTVLGPPSSYKSFFALDLCFHIRLGLEWNGRKTQVGDVVYLCGEGKGGLKYRLRAVRALNDYAGRVGIHFFTNPLTLNESAELVGAINAIERKGIKPRLIVIDTLARFMAGDENTAKDMGAAIRAVDELRRRFGCTVIVIHHSGKDAAKGARGSSALQGAVDAEIVCDKPAGEMTVTVRCTKQKDAAPFRPIILEAVQIAGSLALKPSIPSAETLGGKNLVCLLAVYENDTGNGLTYSEWLAVADVLKPTFDKARSWLRERAYLRLASGRYSVSEAGRQAILSTRSTDGIPRVYSDAVGRSTRAGVSLYTPAVDQTGVLALSPEAAA